MTDRIPGLIVCPTPIGNLSDTSERVRDALSCDIIACEDSRTTGKLLELLGIERSARLVSYHEHNERERAQQLISDLADGRSVVLVSDAGTPAISDPGYRLVAACVEHQIPVSALPGPFAGAVALSASGLRSDRFLFEGFLGKKSSERRKRLQNAWRAGATIVAYESPKRLRSLLEDVDAVFGADARVCVGRELTKKFETYYRGDVSSVLSQLGETVKGECVIVIEVPDSSTEFDAAYQLTKLLVEAGVAPKIIKLVVKEHYGVSKSLVFDWLNEES